MGEEEKADRREEENAQNNKHWVSIRKVLDPKITPFSIQGVTGNERRCEKPSENGWIELTKQREGITGSDIEYVKWRLSSQRN